MATQKAVFFTVGIISSFLIQTQGADKYTDGNRPYEFGFSIDGEQHRHEKKDENGLIMGEFGFVTADGVYHVTVYATDEQGRFKILSMKNIRVKPYPSYKQPAGSARQGHSLDLPTPQPNQNIETPKQIALEKPGRSCSSCSLPTTTTPTPVPAPNVQNIRGGSNANNIGQNEASGNKYPQSPKEYMQTTQQNSFNNLNPQQNLGSSPSFPVNQPNNFNNPQTYSQQGQINLQNGPLNLSGPQKPLEQELVAPKEEYSRYPTINDAQINQQQPGSPPAVPSSIQTSKYPQNSLFGPQNSSPTYATGQDEPQLQQGLNPDRTSKGISGERTAKKYDSETQQPFGFAGAQPNGIPSSNAGGPRINQGDKPTLISAQMQIVDKNTDIYKRGPGETQGLPNGLTKDDMTQLLYTFNYTVGFHGHFEEGYRNGAKQGYYYVTGRNGVRTRVDYVADEQGFRPKITQEVLDLLSDDVPKPETEKEEKYGLKGYEFKWLYYPVESKGQ